MSDGVGYRGGPPGGAHSRQRPERRIGWGAAGRLVDGECGGPGADDLGTLLAVAAAPPSEATLDPARLEPILMAFRAVGAGGGIGVEGNGAEAGAGFAAGSAPPKRSRTRTRSSQSLLVKCAVIFLVVCGGVAAASAGALPSSMQRIAHDYFGEVGIPAPPTSSDAAGSTPPPASSAATGSPSSTPSPGAATGISTAQLMPLCRTVAANPQNWRTGLDADDQAALVAAAGEPGHVKQYCATLLAPPSSNPADGTPSATPSRAQSAEPSPSASPEATATHGNGNGHQTHSPSPNPHSTGH